MLFSHKPQIPGAKITRLSDPEFAMIIAHHWWPERITPRWGPNVQLSCEAKIGITIGEGLRVVACSNIFIYIQLIQGTHDPRSTNGKISDRTANRVTFKLPRIHNRQKYNKVQSHIMAIAPLFCLTSYSYIPSRTAHIRLWIRIRHSQWHMYYYTIPAVQNLFWYTIYTRSTY